MLISSDQLPGAGGCQDLRGPGLHSIIGKSEYEIGTTSVGANDLTPRDIAAVNQSASININLPYCSRDSHSRRSH